MAKASWSVAEAAVADAIYDALSMLGEGGSVVARGFDDPEDGFYVQVSILKDGRRVSDYRIIAGDSGIGRE